MSKLVYQTSIILSGPMYAQTFFVPKDFQFAKSDSDTTKTNLNFM